MKFGIYNKQGIVIRTGDCPDKALGFQAGEGEFLYEGAIALTDRVDVATGKRIEVVVPEKPGEHYNYDPNSNSWVPDPDRAWGAVRFLRDQKIKATDWVILRAADTGIPAPEVWLNYRQSLRDITEQKSPFNIVWPTPPESFK